MKKSQGYGFAETAIVDGLCVLGRLEFGYPLRICPVKSDYRCKEYSAVYVLNYGGGLVSGDNVYMSIRTAHGSCLAVFTQSFTKVYESLGDFEYAEQHLDALVEPSSTLLHLPDPVVGFRRSKYIQTQLFHLECLETSQLALLDWYTQGRAHLNENWSMDLYFSSNRITYTDSRTSSPAVLLTDTVRLEGPEKSTRLAPFECYGVLVLIGKSGLIKTWIDRLRKTDSQLVVNPYSRNASACARQPRPLVLCVSDLYHPSAPLSSSSDQLSNRIGLTLRFASTSTFYSTQFLRELFSARQADKTSEADEHLQRVFLNSWPQWSSV